MPYAYQDFHTGDVIGLGSVTIDREDMLAFAHRFDPQPFHIDPGAAAASLLGGLCASGWYTTALWMRSYADTVLAGSTSQGSPGGRDIRWPAPVFPGDTLMMTATIGPTRLSRSRPGLGLVEITGTAARDGAEVLGLTVTGIFGVREPA